MSTKKKAVKVSDELNAEQSAIRAGTEIAAAGTNVPAVQQAPIDLDAWGVPVITSRDIVIPKILTMQAMSNLVTAGDAKFGEFRDSLNGVVLGDTAHPLEFLPFHMEKVYVVMKQTAKSGDKFQFVKQVPITAMNESHEYEVDAADGKERWYRTLNFYVLLPNELKEGSAIPYVLSFRSSSARAGQKIATTMFMKNIKAGKTPAAMVLELSGKKTTNDKGTFVVMDVRELRPSTKEEVAQAFEWVKTVRAGNVKLDNSDLEAEATGGGTSANIPESSDY